MASFKLSKSSIKNMKDIREGLKILVERVLSKSTHDFGIPGNGGKRTPQEQNNLFHQIPKVTQLDGFKRKSYHQTGSAVDIFILDEHGACWSCIKKYKETADLFKSEFDLMKEEQKDLEEKWFEEDENLYWGGDWVRFKDAPHFEVR